MRARPLLVLGLFLLGTPRLASAAATCVPDKMDADCPADQYCDTGVRQCLVRVKCTDDNVCLPSGRFCATFEIGKEGYCQANLCTTDAECQSSQICNLLDPAQPELGGACADRAFFYQYQGGCAATGSGAGRTPPGPGVPIPAAAALGLIGLAGALRRRRESRARAARSLTTLGAAALFTALAPGAAKADGLNAQTFRPALGPENLITVEGSRAARDLRPFGGLVLDFGYHPLRLVNQASGVTRYPTEQLLTGHAILGMGVTRWFSAGVALPVVFYQSSSSLAALQPFDPSIKSAPSVAGIGDLRLALKFTILDNQHGGVGLAVAPQASFPTGAGDQFRGDDAYNIEPRVAVDYKFKQGSFVALNVSFDYRTSAQEAYNVRVDSQVRYGLGGLFQLPKGLAVVGEVAGAASISGVSAEYGTRYAPLEGALALRWRAASGVQVDLGGGGPFIAAPGVPLFRLFAGVAFYPTPRGRHGGEDPSIKDVDESERPRLPPVVVKRDSDNDGLLDSADKCPTQGGPRENGGCPDSDQDGDGVVDRLDKCVDKAGPGENEGCPDTDKDSDGVVDRLDKCVDVAGVKDLEGCPEPDQDGDGVIDKLDKCVDKPGIKENDGCPDTDKDNDGVVDRLDKCVDKSGPKDNAGCPYLTVAPAEITLAAPIRFAADGAALEDGSKKTIESLGRALGAEEDLKKAVVVVPLGAGKAGAKLGAARAKALQAALVAAGAPKKILLVRPDKKLVGQDVQRVELTRAKAKPQKGKKAK